MDANNAFLIALLIISIVITILAVLYSDYKRGWLRSRTLEHKSTLEEQEDRGASGSSNIVARDPKPV